MHKIGLEFGLEFHEPLAGFIDISPGVGHPLEPEAAFENLEPVNDGSLLPLRSSEWFSHGGERDLDVALAEAADQLEGVVPDAADGIGGHEDLCGRGGANHVSRAFA